MGILASLFLVGEYKKEKDKTKGFLAFYKLGDFASCTVCCSDENVVYRGRNICVLDYISFLSKRNCFFHLSSTLNLSSIMFQIC